VFSVARTSFQIDRLETDFHACGVELQSVLVWAIRENHLMSHHDNPTSADSCLEFNIKIDGRPLGGMTVCSIKIMHACVFSHTGR
jgi:hypothetical protein